MSNLTIADLAKITPEQLSKLSPEERTAVLGQIAAQLGVDIKAQAQGTIVAKAQPKGTISLYGLQRMPITLYRAQWQRFWENAEAIRKQVEGCYELAGKNASRYDSDAEYKVAVDKEAKAKTEAYKARSAGAK